jgi:hypothetical protein
MRFLLLMQGNTYHAMTLSDIQHLAAAEFPDDAERREVGQPPRARPALPFLANTAVIELVHSV